MSPARPRKRSWRLYRNWLIAALVWIAFFATIAMIARSPIHILWAVPVYFVGLAILRGFTLTHPRGKNPMPFCWVRGPMMPGGPCTAFRGGQNLSARLTPGDFGLHARQVEFPNRDKLTLSGWYAPGHNQAAVILVHGAGAFGVDMVDHAKALKNHGYGVLMFDLRAHGRSEGETCTYGWRETADLLGALDYLQNRADVDAGRIGVLGFSLGGQIALRAAAQSEAIRGVVADGPSAASLADRRREPMTPGRWLGYPLAWLGYTTLSLLNGAHPPTGVLAAVGDIAPRPILLISTGRTAEQAWVREVYKAASEPKDLWELPDAQHGGGLFFDPAAYTHKITSFFDAALLSGDV